MKQKNDDMDFQSVYHWLIYQLTSHGFQHIKGLIFKDLVCSTPIFFSYFMLLC